MEEEQPRKGESMSDSLMSQQLLSPTYVVRDPLSEIGSVRYLH